jgi:hypothetical protein
MEPNQNGLRRCGRRNTGGLEVGFLFRCVRVTLAGPKAKDRAAVTMETRRRRGAEKRGLEFKARFRGKYHRFAFNTTHVRAKVRASIRIGVPVRVACAVVPSKSIDQASRDKSISKKGAKGAKEPNGGRPHCVTRGSADKRARNSTGTRQYLYRVGTAARLYVECTS